MDSCEHGFEFVDELSDYWLAFEVVLCRKRQALQWGDSPFKEAYRMFLCFKINSEFELVRYSWNTTQNVVSEPRSRRKEVISKKKWPTEIDFEYWKRIEVIPGRSVFHINWSTNAPHRRVSESVSSQTVPANSFENKWFLTNGASDAVCRRVAGTD